MFAITNKIPAHSHCPWYMKNIAEMAAMPMIMNSASNRFLMPAKSATAPRMGDTTATRMMPTIVKTPYRQVAVESGNPDTAEKKVGNTAVIMMVTIAEFAQSY